MLSKVPLISCVMPTYGRPDFVHESVQMFFDQDYPHKELIILNDCAGQIYRFEHPDVRVFNVETRFNTLGEKRNAAIQLARGEVIAVWDDDDVYLPWHLSFSLAEMQRHQTPLYRPAEYWAWWETTSGSTTIRRFAAECELADTPRWMFGKMANSLIGSPASVSNSQDTQSPSAIEVLCFVENRITTICRWLAASIRWMSRRVKFESSHARFATLNYETTAIVWYPIARRNLQYES